MDKEERPVQCALEQTNQYCDCLNIQSTNRECKNENNNCDIESNHPNSRASITRQCFAAIIGKFKCLYH